MFVKIHSPVGLFQQQTKKNHFNFTRTRITPSYLPRKRFEKCRCESVILIEGQLKLCSKCIMALIRKSCKQLVKHDEES